MVEQIQTTPPFDALASLGVAASDTTKLGTNHTGATGTHSAVTPGKADDTVTLSASAQANQLYLQGNSVSQIAAQLGLPSATVLSDLNVTQNELNNTQTTVNPAGDAAAAQSSTGATAAAFGPLSTPFTSPTAAATSANVS